MAYDEYREREKLKRQIQQELTVTMRMLLNTPGWDAFEKYLAFELDELVASLATPMDTFDVVRFKQGQILVLRDILKLKKDILNSAS